MRQTKLKAALFSEVVSRVRAGHWIKDACKAVGIPRSTLYAYLDRNPDKLDTLKRAEIERDSRLDEEAIASIQKAFATSWQAAAWWLERNHPERFSLRGELRHLHAHLQAPRKSAEESSKEFQRKLARSKQLRKGVRRMLEEAERVGAAGRGEG